ncbi:Subtilisin-like serine protease [Deinococcus saxicola]|uniref:S8 family peptidase n=1 Tax=Deinococcus saxicola TaxID=249406 RepID=UPI0039EF3063
MTMKSLKSVLALSLSLTLAACGQQTSPGQSADLSAQALTTSPSQRFVIVFKDQRVPADAAQRVSAAGGRVLKAVPEAGVATVSGNAAVRAKLERDSAVLAVGLEHLYTLPTNTERVAADASNTDGAYSATAADTLYKFQWDMRRIGAQVAANRVGSAQAGITVGVLDVGVMSDHPDMVNQLAFSTGTNYCQETGKDGTTGYPVYSKFIDFDAHPEWSPADGCATANTVYEDHGTHVAGTVAGAVGGGGIVGVAPGAKIAAYKVFDRYRYTDAQGTLQDGVGGFDGPIFSAIVDAANRGVNIINMSLGGTLDRSNKDDNASWLAWQRVMNYADKKGTLIIASAGNAAESSNGAVAHIPSDVPGIMSVSASGVTALTTDAGGNLVANGPDVLAFYSNYGASTDIAAPGGDCGTNSANGLSWCDRPSGNRANRPATYFHNLILSSVIDYKTGKADYAWFAGTSMASPHVAGVAALVKAQHPEFSTNQLKAYLKRTAENVGQKQRFGSGLANADLATR